MLDLILKEILALLSILKADLLYCLFGPPRVVTWTLLALLLYRGLKPRWKRRFPKKPLRYKLEASTIQELKEECARLQGNTGELMKVILSLQRKIEQKGKGNTLKSKHPSKES